MGEGLVGVPGSELPLPYGWGYGWGYGWMLAYWFAPVGVPAIFNDNVIYQ